MPADLSQDELEQILREWDILVVDDNPASLSMLRSMLAVLGLKPPLEALDGAEAMELVRNNDLGCIITDIRMEPMSGPDFVRWVRRSNEAANPTVRILAMSAYRDGREIEAIRNEGANGFIGKPLSVPVLEAILQAVARDPGRFVEADPATGALRTQPRLPAGGQG